MHRITSASRNTAASEAEPEQLDHARAAEDERGEDDDHHGGGGGDHAAGRDEAVADGGAPCRAAASIPRGCARRERPRSPSRGRRRWRTSAPAGTPRSGPLGTPGNQPNWKTATITPSDGGDREQVHHRRLERDHAASGRRPASSSAESRTTTRDEEPELRREHAGEVDEGRGRAADVDGRAGLLLERRDHVPLRRSLTRFARRGALRRGARGRR